MTFFYFLRGLWLRVKFPVRRFYADTVRFGEPLLIPSDAYFAERKAEKEAVEAGARLTSHDHPLLKTAPVGKPDKIVIVDPPLLRGDYGATLDRVMRTKTP